MQNRYTLLLELLWSLSGKSGNRFSRETNKKQFRACLVQMDLKDSATENGRPDGPVLPDVTDDLSWGRIAGCFRQ